MFNSSAGRWRQRLHLPTSARRGRRSATPGLRLTQSSSSSIPEGSANGNYRSNTDVRDDGENNSGSVMSAATAPISTPQHPNPGQSILRFSAHGTSSSSSYASSGPIRLPIPRSDAPSTGWTRNGSGTIISAEFSYEGSRPRHDLAASSAQATKSSQLQPPLGQVATIASIVILSLVAYALYHASIEALVDETGTAWLAAERSEPQQLAHDTPPLAMKVDSDGESVQAASVGGDGGGSAMLSDGWGPGVSVVTVSAWQSLCALGVGFVASRMRKMSAWRKTETRTVDPGERTRRDRCLLAFAAAHLLGTALEYHTYGVVGALGAEILRPTETAYFCLLSLSLGRLRGRLARMPALLLALGLALSAAPASGDLRVGGVGLLISLASNALLAIRALTAKIILGDFGMDEISTFFSCSKLVAGLQVMILLAVEVPRAASGLPPYLLAHLWGVGVGGFEKAGASIGEDGDGAAEANEGWITAAGEHRARLAFLLLVNGLCLYGHVLALFALLSRLSATVFAILSGYVHAALVFVLLLSLEGFSGPRSAGMLLSTVAVAAHFFRTSTSNSGSGTNGRPGSPEEGGGPDKTHGGGAEVGDHAQLPVFLRESANKESPISRSRGTVDMGSVTRGDSRPSPEFRAVKRPRGLFVPLLGTAQAGGMEAEAKSTEVSIGEEPVLPESAPSGGLSSHASSRSLSSSWPSPSQSSDGKGEEGEAGGYRVASPSRFTWRWMGLRPAEESGSALRSVQDGERSRSQALRADSGDLGIAPLGRANPNDDGRQGSMVGASRPWGMVSQDLLESGQSGRASNLGASARSGPPLHPTARLARDSATPRPETRGAVMFNPSAGSTRHEMTPEIGCDAASGLSAARDEIRGESGGTVLSRAAGEIVGGVRVNSGVTRLSPDDHVVVVADGGGAATFARPRFNAPWASMPDSAVRLRGNPMGAAQPTQDGRRTAGSQRLTSASDGITASFHLGSNPLGEPAQVAHVDGVAVELTSSAEREDGGSIGRMRKRSAGDAGSTSSSSLSLTSFEVIDKEDELWR